jgi:hypothetical protein
MFQLEQTTHLRLVVAVPESEVGGIVKGSRVPFTVSATRDKHLQGWCRGLHSVDPKTRTMAVEMDVMNPGLLASGMYRPSCGQCGNPSITLGLLPASSPRKTFVIRVEWRRRMGTGNAWPGRGRLVKSTDPFKQMMSYSSEEVTRCARNKAQRQVTRLAGKIDAQFCLRRYCLQASMLGTTIRD